MMSIPGRSISCCSARRLPTIRCRPRPVCCRIGWGYRPGCGALDFNLGCSGFVYGLAMADGLIRTGAVRRVLLITAETYTKYIAHDDRSLRTIFSDAAAATLIEARDEPSLAGIQVWHGW